VVFLGDIGKVLVDAAACRNGQSLTTPTDTKKRLSILDGSLYQYDLGRITFFSIKVGLRMQRSAPQGGVKVSTSYTHHAVTEVVELLDPLPGRGYGDEDRKQPAPKKFLDVCFAHKVKRRDGIWRQTQNSQGNKYFFHKMS
jgi:hypothetical protein